MKQKIALKEQKIRKQINGSLFGGERSSGLMKQKIALKEKKKLENK
jgi:hypothetical protein